MILEYDLGPYLVREGTGLKEALQQLDRERLRMLLCVDLGDRRVQGTGAKGGTWVVER